MNGKVEVAITASASAAKKSVIELSKVLDSLVGAATSASKAVFGFTKNLALSTVGVGKFQSGLGKLLESMNRIVFYRAIRTVIREITQGFKEGVNNLYQYSIALNNIDAGHAVWTMNEFATTALYVKNSLGAALMPILNALVPVVISIANAFVAAANAVNQFIHALRGNDTFTKAKRYAVEYADALDNASGSAKELKKQVFGFDELNIFNSPSSGGGGGGDALDYSEMFEESPISNFMKDLKAKIEEGNWEEIGQDLANRVNDLVKNIDTTGLGKRLGTKISNAFKLGVNFLLTFDFKEVGRKVAELMNGIFDEVDFTDVGTFLARKLTAVFDFAMGFIETFDFHDFGAAIKNVVVGFFDHLSDWLDGVDWYSFGQTFWKKIYDFATGIDFASIAESVFTFFGEALFAAWDFIAGFVDSLSKKVSDYFAEKTEECGGNAALGFLNGVLDVMKNIASWIYEHIIFPFVDAFIMGFDIQDGASNEMAKIGEESVVGLMQGFGKRFKELLEMVKEWVAKIKEPLNSLHDAIWKAEPMSKRQADYGLFANGGMPETGTLFFAGEAGPELVGSVGGRSSVTNQEQFTSGMADIMDTTNTVILQAAQALISAIQNKDMTAVVSIGDRQIVSAYDRGKKLAGASLVE